MSKGTHYIAFLFSHIIVHHQIVRHQGSVYGIPSAMTEFEQETIVDHWATLPGTHDVLHA